MQKKKPIRSIIFLIILVFTQIQPISMVNGQEQPLNIVVSVELLKDFVEEIGGDFVQVNAVLVDGTEDPHTYEPAQSEIQALIEADIIVLMGRSDLEPWWEGEQGQGGGYKDIVLQDNPDLIIVSVLNSSMIKTDPLLDRENPHAWMSPDNAKAMINNIYVALKNQLPSENGAILTTQYISYNEKLDQLNDNLLANRTKYEGLKVVVHHPSFLYLLDELGIERIGVIEEQHDVEPSPQQIQTIKDNMTKENCTIIISQANLEESVVLQLARDTGAEIVWGIPLLGMSGRDGQEINSYIDMINYNIWALDNPEPPTPADQRIPSFPTSILFLCGIIGILIISFGKQSQN